jgi:hypothetical protein
MRKLIAIVVACAFSMTACAPSLSYRLGQGFYSETFAKTQVQSAANAGKVKNLGRFSVKAGGCGNYSQDMADENIVIPAIKSKLKELGANVADNVVANEEWYDFLLGLLIIPALMACSNWTISGEALLVEQSTMNELQKMAEVGEATHFIFFKSRRQQP